MWYFCFFIFLGFHFSLLFFYIALIFDFVYALKTLLVLRFVKFFNLIDVNRFFLQVIACYELSLFFIFIFFVWNIPFIFFFLSKNIEDLLFTKPKE